jgi:ribosomal protein L37AE/L43A
MLRVRLVLAIKVVEGEPMECPVCNVPARVKKVERSGGCNEVSCPTCGEFDVSRSVLKAWKNNNTPKQERKAMLEKARKKAQGKKPRITEDRYTP